MRLPVNGHDTYCYTGGRAFDPALPTAVLIHGVLNDHSVWAMQSRWLAHHGWNVLAVDLPGHCRSAGPAPQSVEEAADFTIALLDALGVAERVAGRSRGEGSSGAVAGTDTAIVIPPARKRVLLVDDSISVRRFVGQMLEKAGFDVTTAADGADAITRLGEAAFDVLVTDLEMPRVNGYELIDDLRRRASTRTLPVIVLTTRAGDKHVALARQLGVDHYVTKPVEEQTFVALVGSVVHG